MSVITAESVPWPRLLVDAFRPHIVAVACLGCATFDLIFTRSISPAAVSLCAVDWFLVNLLNRIADLPEDERNGVSTATWLPGRARAIQTGFWGVLAVSFVATYWFAPYWLVWRAAYHSLGLLYNGGLPWLPWRLKTVGWLKIHASSIGFLLTVFGYPLSRAWATRTLCHDISTETVLCLSLFFYSVELSMELVYDLRDIPGDRWAGILTLPVLYGEQRTARLIAGLLLAAGLFLVFGSVMGWIPWRGVVLIAAPIWLGVQVLRWIQFGRVTGELCRRLTWQLAGLNLAYLLWTVSGLPGA